MKQTIDIEWQSTFPALWPLQWAPHLPLCNEKERAAHCKEEERAAHCKGRFAAYQRGAARRSIARPQHC